MLFLSHYVVAILTFPGVIVHEFAHRLFCDLTKTDVYDEAYFRLNDDDTTVGFVVHAQPKSLLKSFLISFGPLIVNTILCMVLTFPFTLKVGLNLSLGWSDIFMEWVGICIGIHAIPSNQDAKSFKEFVGMHKGEGVLYVISLALSLFFWIANLLRFFWFDVFFALLISGIVPHFFFPDLKPVIQIGR
jgi:hypothetical protein